MPFALVNSSSSPFLPADPRIHSQTGNHLVFRPAAPFGSTQQPVRQGDDPRCFVRAITFVGVFDGVGGYASLRVEGKDEHTGEFISFAQVEDWFIPTKQSAQATIDSRGRVAVSRSSVHCRPGV